MPPDRCLVGEQSANPYSSVEEWVHVFEWQAMYGVCVYMHWVWLALTHMVKHGRQLSRQVRVGGLREGFCVCVSAV